MHRVFLLLVCLYCVRAAVIGGSRTQDGEDLKTLQDTVAVLPERTYRETTESALRQKRSGYSQSWAKSWATAWSYGGGRASITAVAPSHGGGTAIANAIAQSYGNSGSQSRAEATVFNQRRWRRSDGK